ncbi:DNA helicase [Arthrobacter phage Racecar]|nr:DNA helicase [Arthrobacter phage Racecar]
MTKSTQWADIFAPVMAQGREIRTGQAALGQAIIDAIETKTSLVAQASTGTGKSFASIIPIINAIQKAKKAKKPFRGVVSTETLTLMDQLYTKDLPFLASLYKGFEYRKLMGRSNYLCLEIAEQATIGDMVLNGIVAKLKTRQSNLGIGERKDVERVIGRELTNEQWAKIASSSQFCPDNVCSGEKCYSTRARAEALKADLLIVNHAILATDLDMKISSGDGPLADGMLGQFEVLVVDEGHQLEPVLVSSWTKELTERELEQMAGSVTEGVDLARAAASNETIGLVANNAMENFRDVLANIKKYFMLLEESTNGEWKDSSTALSLKYPLGMPSGPLAYAMNEFEEENPVRLAKIDESLQKVIKYLEPAVEIARDNKIKGVRKMNKGLRAAKDLLDMARIMSKALETKDGIIHQYGTYGALVDGWEKRDGTPGMTIRLVPLDVSSRAEALWGNGGQANILLSATLTDLTDGSFRYARQCVGFPNGPEINVDTPFSYQTQQLVYITPANREMVDGARYSFSELIDLLNVSRGRALVLFTSRKELDWAAEQLKRYQALGHFNYPIYVQEKEANKNKLMEAFKSDTHSVLLATKSFFVGIDVPGESLSLVALVKFPLPRYSAECRQQIAHWKSRGFPRWYEREALTIFQQASGRLIRSSGCKGTVALLDFRAMDTTSNVYKTMKLGVDSLGSPVTQRLDVVKNFLQ